MRGNTIKKLAACCLLALFFLSLYRPALAQTAAGVALPEDRQSCADRLSDDNVLTRVPLAAGEALTLRLEEETHGLTLKWQQNTAEYTLTQYDGTGAELTEEQAAAGFLNRYHALLPDCRMVVLTLLADAELCELAWYTASEPLPSSVQHWEETETKADLLVIAATPGEELWMCGGLLPLYAVEHEIPTVVVYLTCEKRLYAEEALEALWRLGIHSYPLFAEEIPILNPESEKWVKAGWQDRNLLRDWLVWLIRRYRPRVAVTGGFHAEASAAARVSGEALTQAAECAASAECSPGSAESYGLWQLDKVYVQGERAETGAPTRLDGTIRLFSAGEKTLDAQTEYAYAAYRTQARYRRGVTGGAAFTPTFSTVGADTAFNDLWEHIDVETLTHYISPTPTPTPVLTPRPTPVPTETPVPELPGRRRADGAASLVAVCLALGLTVSVVLYVTLKRKPGSGEGKRGRLWLCLIPLACSLAASACLVRIKNNMDGPAVSPTPTATAAPTPTDTPQPTETPAPTPTPTPAPKWPDMFRREGEPEEVIVADAEAGRWSYKTDTLGLFVERRFEELPDGRPLTYFVAHIYMQDVQEFRPIFGSDARNGRGATMPWAMARRARAALLVSGDNMINMDHDLKGTILRDGRVFCQNKAADTVALYPDMSLRIFSPNEITAAELLCAGVENTFSFGPTLIRDGVVNDQTVRHRLRSRNPRVGIGMVEPGHLVMIAVDGRDRKYSVGASLTEFTEIFQRENCTQAYNLDGGASVAILFMGEQINYHANHPGDAQRPIPDGLAWGYSRQVPTEFDPVANKGVHDR